MGPQALPAIAVLSFTNISDDPEQEYFSDGISEDIITALSKLRWFFVIARNSSFIYKGKAVHMKQIAEELGVGYVVEGSVRTGGDRVRITVQLNDVATGSHIWAERYDRGLADVSGIVACDKTFRDKAFPWCVRAGTYYMNYDQPFAAHCPPMFRMAVVLPSPTIVPPVVGFRVRSAN